MNANMSLAKLTEALVAAQAEFAPLEKSATNPHFKNKFVPLAEVLSNVLPVLSKHGLAVAQFPTEQNGNAVLATYLLHTSGEYLAHPMLLNAVKNDPQGMGSAITYARRYALMSILGLVGDEDDDANAATPQARTQVRQTPLEAAKSELRAAISKAQLGSDQAKEYAWVATATDKDIDNIKGLAAALNSGTAV